MTELLVGPNQQCPMRCHTCGDRFREGEPIRMRPVLREGERAWVGRWPEARELELYERGPRGRVLWYSWECAMCSIPEFLQERARREAERELARRNVAASRARRQWGVSIARRR